MMNSKLQEERFKAKQLLEYANQLQMESLSVPRATFNLSDLKSDKTQYIESPYHRKRSPFKSSEISARSTLSRQHVEKNTNNDMDFDEIMRTSSSQAVRNKYRESIGMGRLSSLPRTEDMSFRSTMSTSSFTRNADRNDFWDDAKIAVNSFDNQQVSMDSDEFQPAEKMMEQIADDEMEQQKEFATIPRVKKTNSNESNWQERSSRQPEMSFGQYCQDYVEDIRDIYSSNSPAKKNRVALVDVSNVDVSLEPSNRIGRSHLQKLIQNYDTPKAEELILNVGRNINRLHDNIATKARIERDPVISGIDSMLNSMNFDEIIEKAKRNAERARIEKKNSQARLDSIPVQDGKKEFLYPDDSLNREINAIPGRGQKRRSVNLETPRSALDKCMRSKSPDEQRVQKQLAASMLKPKFYDNEFKVPHSSTSIKPNFSSTIFSPMRSSRAESRTDGSHNHSPTSREYVTANSMNSPAEKLSLPNYGLVRPENPFTSPTSSLRSDDLSPIAPEEGKLKRTVSQLSNGSEFYDDVLPIKIKKAHMKVSWESVKLYKTVSKTVSIQNGSHKKLPLKVRVIGAGFSVSPREDFRMIPQEARSFEVKFTPTVIGPVRGQLVFELATNNKVSKTIPLFAYGGHAAIRIEGVQKGPLGPAFVTMGHVNGLNRKMEQQLRLVNHGTLPGFASLLFEKTKWSDFSLSSSLNLSPSQVRLGPGESVEVNVAFRATKDEIFKIIKLNKEVTIVGEICIIAGDEPTRLRLINNKEHVPTQFLKFLPKGLPNEVEFKRELVLFNENLDRTKLSSIMEQIKTHEVALTVSRNLDETQIFAADLSMADETTLTFETFCDTNCNRTVFDQKSSNETLGNDPGFFDCRFFRLVPAQLIFSRSRDDLNEPKSIFIESTSDDELFVEAVSSNHELITAIKSCGVIKPHGTAQFKVTLKTRAQDPRIKESMYVTVLIGNAKVDVPVKFVN